MTDETISPLRRRMIEDMTVRGFTACTQRGYIAAVKNFTTFLGRLPDQGSAEDLRRFQLHMRSEGASATTMNAAVSALRFFFTVTLGRGDAQAGMTTVREPRRLPVILSPEEVARLLDAAPGLKYRAALSVAYGAGLRASEVASLKSLPPPRRGSRTSTVTASGWSSGSNRARAARTAMPCCRSRCSSSCALGGWRPVNGARCCPEAGCSLARTRSTP